MYRGTRFNDMWTVIEKLSQPFTANDVMQHYGAEPSLIRLRLCQMVADGALVTVGRDAGNRILYAREGEACDVSQKHYSAEEVWDKAASMDPHITSGGLAAELGISHQKAGDWLRRFVNEGRLVIINRDHSGNIYAREGEARKRYTAEEIWLAIGKMAELNNKLTTRTLATTLNIAPHNARSWLSTFSMYGHLEAVDRDSSGTIYKVAQPAPCPQCSSPREFLSYICGVCNYEFFGPVPQELRSPDGRVG